MNASVEVSIVTAISAIVLGYQQWRMKIRDVQIARDTLRHTEEKDDEDSHLRTLEVAIDKVPEVLMKTIRWQDAENERLRTALASCREQTALGDADMLPRAVVRNGLVKALGEAEGKHIFDTITRVDELRRGKT